MAGNIKVVFNDLDKLKGQMRQRAGQVVRKTALDIEAEAKANVRVDTGAAKNSIYSVTNGSDGYSAAASAAQAANPGVELHDKLPPPGAFRAYVAVGVVYGIVLEMGSARMAGVPFMAPAAEKVRPAFESAMKQLFDASALLD
jgi:HK97 gp10 family phage protein